MRYRGTDVQRNRNGKGMGDTPSWRPNTDAYCYSRALLVTLFFADFRSGNAGFMSGMRTQYLCFYLQRFIRLAAYHASGPPTQHTGSQGPNTRQDGICNRKFSAAPYRRAHGISLKEIQRSQDVASPGREPARASTIDAHCLFTRTACCFILCGFCISSGASNLVFGCFLDWGEFYGANMSKLRAEIGAAMSLSAHAMETGAVY